MKQLTAYFFENKVEKSSQLLKRFKEKYLIKNTFLHYTIRKELKVWKIKNYTSIHYVLQWYSYHL